MSFLEIIGLISIILWPLSIVGYVIYNLYTKNIALEQGVIDRDQYINSIQNLILSSDKIIKDFEISGAFKADDEAGGFFRVMKEIQEEINAYNTLNNK